jgi:3-hydroxyacyl-CoA dehydrogenase
MNSKILLLKIASQNSRFYSTTSIRNAIKHVTVIGGGLMGQGITQVVAQSGYSVSVVDQNDKILKKAVDGIHASLKRVAKKTYEKDPQVGFQMVEISML